MPVSHLQYKPSTTTCLQTAYALCPGLNGVDVWVQLQKPDTQKNKCPNDLDTPLDLSLYKSNTKNTRPGMKLNHFLLLLE